tara:strand:+ start:2074 stop:3309 length:1236 start_codon:yes stop_codon:yes gene_type:complete
MESVELSGTQVTPGVRDRIIQHSGWDDEQVALIKRTVAEGTTDDEFAMFLHYCQTSGLDPLRRQAHCIVREWVDKRGNEKRQTTMMTGIDGFRARAESFPDFLGIQSGVVFQGDDFSIDYATCVVHHVAHFPRKTKGPTGAWAVVKRTGRDAFIHYCDWQELFDNFSPMHKKMPEVMARKTVEAQALRHEYPEPFSGLYDPAEIPSAGEPLLNLLDDAPVQDSGGASPALPASDAPAAPRVDNGDGTGGVPDPAGGDEAAEREVAGGVGIDADIEQDEIEPPTEAQIERWVDITEWAEDVGLMTESVHEEALAWIDGPPKPSTRAVGAKIGIWKSRRDRWDAESEGMFAAAKDMDCSDDDREEAVARFRAWVMNPKTRIQGQENSPEKIISWLDERVDLPLDKPSPPDNVI